MDGVGARRPRGAGPGLGPPARTPPPLRPAPAPLALARVKLVTGQLGHAAGDRLLSLVATALRQQCRTLDAVGRMGGDEFLVVLPMTTPAEAMVFVSRVQKSIAAIERSHPEFGRPTLSMGLAESPRHSETITGLLAAADSALYKAKRGGRDAVEVAEAL